MLFESSEFTASIQGGVLKVIYNEERELQVTHVRDGEVTQETINSTNADKSEAKLLAGLNRMPLFSATYQGNGEWSCDIDAGFQRWRGYKSGKIVSSTLKQCGFDAPTVRKILRVARKHIGVYCPREW